MLPYSYNEDRLFLVPVDPNTLMAYWDFCEATWQKLTQQGATHLNLTLHCEDSSRTFGTAKETRSYYFKGIPSDREYWLELGYAVHNAVFPLKESLPVRSPADRPSENRRVQFRRFQFLSPPQRPGQALEGWREVYRQGAGRWGMYGNLADPLRLSTPLRTPPTGVAPMEDGPEALFYYNGRAEIAAGTSSGALSSPHRREADPVLSVEQATTDPREEQR